MLDLQKFRAAAVQASPVFLNVDATVEKACSIIAEAAGNAAQLVAFPEVFVAGYPYWNWIMTPVQGSRWYEQLYKNSIAVPGPETQRLCEAAREHNCHVVIGVNERGQSLGEIYNTEIGPIGTLACGENTNTLARFTLLSQGELIHIANYISLPVAPPDYNMAEAIKIRAAAHSFEGKLFTIVSCSTITPEIIEAMKADVPNAEELLTRKNSAFSGIIGPNGAVVGEPLIDEEGIVYADIDLNLCIQPKQMHDILGHYNRFDIFELKVNNAPQKNITFHEGEKGLER